MGSAESQSLIINELGSPPPNQIVHTDQAESRSNSYTICDNYLHSRHWKSFWPLRPHICSSYAQNDFH